MHSRRLYHQWPCWIWASSSSASSPATVGLISGSCSSARTFALRFFRAPPRDECDFTLALRYDFTSIRLSKGLSPSSCRACSAHKKKPPRKAASSFMYELAYGSTWNGTLPTFLGNRRPIQFSIGRLHQCCGWLVAVRAIGVGAKAVPRGQFADGSNGKHHSASVCTTIP